MRKKSVLIGRWIGIIPVLLILAGFGGAALGQACGETGCWALREPIYIYGNSEFTYQNGVVSGSGSQYDPYIIGDWRIVASGSSYAINIENTSKYFVIKNCIVEGAADAGIRFYSVEKGSIEDCHLLRNERGILFENSRDNGIVSNLIADNRYGVDLIVGTRNTSVTKNSFINNGRNGYDPGGRNIWYCAAIGNYWHDYDGADRDYDGIGDEPHRAPVDRYPLISSPWQCALPVNDICGPHCDDSTQILKATGLPPLAQAGPCATPCAPDVTCPSTPNCAPPCSPEISICADQILTCSNPVATLTANFLPTRPSCEPCDFQWIRDGGAVVGTGSAINVTQPGTYTVTIAGADRCSVSKSVIVVTDANAPVVRASADGELSCGIEEVQLQAAISGGVAPYDINWNRSGSDVLGCETCLLVSEPGTYTVTVTGANGCSSTDTVTVVQDLQAPRVTAVVDGELTCNINQVRLTALASNGQLPYSYEWRNPSGNSVGSSSEVYVSQPGTYSVQVTGANGCTALGTVIVTEDAGAPAVSIIGNDILTCSIAEVTLTANISRGRPPYHIEWTGPSGNIVGTSPILSATRPGTYTATVRGANGCETIVATDVIQDIAAPTVDAGPDHMLSNEVAQVTVTAAVTSPSGSYSVAWENDSGDVLATTESITINRPGEYTVTVTRETGCSASDTVIVNSSVITEVMLDSGIEGLAVFGQLTIDGVPIPETTFYFLAGSTQELSGGVEISSVSIRTGTGQGYEANGAEVSYIIPGNSTVTFQIHHEQFIAGKWYQILHLPIDPPGQASVKFF
ncbi:NosD domain-containing protein [Candidatus Bipolaricaulota bacterium]